ncbi:hypothetical protein [Xanthomonas translucens]|uniref:hypothetical protein n=1 Tax=Xanthomonas campestris pv. translucens TaxID=343 RepID=UPI00071E79F7|nr:hypothetical protein [Xanthomonas translucens]AVY67618.1 ATP-dependent helicase HrpA [Xanthomonas translucens pv. undulosa]UPU48547.1 ATP-dependent helicase HrpA [Xanthomonas translucens pv. undulosa]WLA02028.1 ATP-dependent helicase HrpA [Xanthomonas translucens]WLA09584.1 ATP-dependent helicase HrpA [Xanthomonas translucens]WLA11368.1 ATP-dependent helicase HrpA [Xanthomonas translucens]
MSFPFSALGHGSSTGIAAGSFGMGLKDLGISGMSGMGNNLIAGGQMGGMIGNMRTNVSEQEAMMDQVTALQNELNFHMAMDSLAKQAGSNAKQLTSGS